MREEYPFWRAVDVKRRAKPGEKQSLVGISDTDKMVVSHRTVWGYLDPIFQVLLSSSNRFSHDP